MDPGGVEAFHYYTGSEQFIYNSLFFHAASLNASATHTVTWKLNETATNGTSALFDYAIITVEDPVPVPSASVPQCVATSLTRFSIHSSP